MEELSEIERALESVTEDQRVRELTRALVELARGQEEALSRVTEELRGLEEAEVHKATVTASLMQQVAVLEERIAVAD
jgi:hypothetical protein